MKAKKNYSFIIVAIILIAVLLFKNFYLRSDRTHSEVAFNRNDERIILTTHARCRMDCRHITKEEVKEILHDGNINYKKSNPNDKRGAEYALEGYTHEQQHLRVVVAPKTDGLIIVTCIDLDTEWQCNCN